MASLNIANWCPDEVHGTERSFVERWFTLPWRPWRKRSFGGIAIYQKDGKLYCGPETYEVIMKHDWMKRQFGVDD